MGRARRRHWVNQYRGSNHLISRITGGDFLLQKNEKEYFVKLMFKFAEGFFIDIHSYTVMSNHFHILATVNREEVEKSTEEELIARYKKMYGKRSEHPQGSYKTNGELIPDDDGGIERLRYRLGSTSKFIQELKQTFSKWYNKKHNRKGYLWNDRFKMIIMENGEPELICSAYIDLNAVRAGIVKKPEDYRWCSVGLKVRNPRKAKLFLKTIIITKEKTITTVDKKTGWLKQSKKTQSEELSFPVYRAFLYNTGCEEVQGKVYIHSDIYQDAMKLNGKLNIGDKLKYRFRNLSEGIAAGSFKFIERIQIEDASKYIKPRKIINKDEDNECKLYSTRNLKPI